MNIMDNYDLVCLCVLVTRHVQHFATTWTVTHQVPLSMEFSRQEYWSGSHFLLQGIFLTQVLNLGFLHCFWKLPWWLTR